MKNRKGFTLVELLAVIVILGVIMLIAVPNVMSIVDKEKKTTYIQDAYKLQTLVEYATRTNTSIKMPDANEILVVPLSAVNNGDLTTGPDGYQYSLTNSYVAIMKENGFDKYWVNLVGENGTKNRGVYLCSMDSLEGDMKYNQVVKDMVIPKNQDIARVMCGSTTCKTVRTYIK